MKPPVVVVTQAVNIIEVSTTANTEACFLLNDFKISSFMNNMIFYRVPIFCSLYRPSPFIQGSIVCRQLPPDYQYY